MPEPSPGDIFFDFEGDPFRQPGPQALPRGTIQLDMDRVVGQQLAVRRLGHFVGEHGAHHAVDIDNFVLDTDFFAALEGWLGQFDQHIIQCLVETVILVDRLVDLGRLVHLLRGHEDTG